MEQENNNLNQNDNQDINKLKNEEVNNEENHEDNTNNEMIDNQEDNIDENDNNIDNENTDVEETPVSDVDEETEIEENNDNINTEEQTDEDADVEKQADEDNNAEVPAEEEPIVNQENDTSEDEKPISGKKRVILIVILILILIASALLTYFVLTGNREGKNPKPDDKPIEQKEDDGKEEIPKENEEENKEYLTYQIRGNSIGDFDLQFLKLENNNKNVIYSPLSIKYALEMLKEGTNGETKGQIERIIGDYTPKKYANNTNMSFANAMFIRDTKKSMIKSEYVDNLTKNYNAAIIYDSFKNPNNINKWIKEKTFNLIDNLVNDVSETNYILTNALAIDMEWEKKLQAENTFWFVSYIHEDYSKYINSLVGDPKDHENIDKPNYKELDFKDNQKVAAVEIGAVANRYDIVNVMGIDKVKDIVGTAYQKWLNEGAENSCYDPEISDPSEKDPDRETFVNNYIDEINKNYNKLSSSTDYSFYVDDNIKIFSKDLKEYSGTTLQYIAIMPTRLDLATFIKSNNANDITTLISKLQPMEINSFKDGVITEITGYIPMFKFDYKLDLTNDLKKIGITNVFDLEKADFSNMTTEPTKVTDTLHKSTIEFSNSGIKAAAVSVLEQGGGGDCGFDYIFEIPKDRIQKIDLTFNRPFLFLIVDKNTKEVWFTGSVYQPAEYDAYVKSIKVYNPWES